MKRYNNVITIYESDHDANYKNNVYQTQGLGTLPDATTALVENEFQQALVLNMLYPINGHNADLLKEERIIQTQVSADKTQQLRIYEVKKSLSGLHYEVKAEPIFNTVRKHFITKLVNDNTVSIDTAWQMAINACYPAIDKAIYKIQVNSDATNSMAKINFEAGNLLQFIAGKEGSLLDYRNPLEFEKDNSTLIVGRKLGKEHAFTATYTRNLTGLDYTINTQGVVTSYYPFAKVKLEGEEEEKLIELNPKVIILDSAKLYTGITKTLDFSQDESVTDVASLQKAYDAYFKANEAERTPQVTVKIDVVSLRNQQGYENFISWQSINVGDSVDVIHGEWNMTLTARVLKYEYDVLTDRYNSVEVGDAKKTFIDNINDNINGNTSNILDKVQDIIDTLPTKGDTQELLDEMADKITGNAGGNIVLDPPTRPERLLIMDTDNINTAKNIIMMNKAGILMGQNGIDGDFSSAWSIEGIFNAKWIQTGILSGNNLRVNLDTGEVNFSKGQIQSLTNDFLIDITSRKIKMTGKSNTSIANDNLSLAIMNGELRTNFGKTFTSTENPIFAQTYGNQGLALWVHNNTDGVVPVDANYYGGPYKNICDITMLPKILNNGARTGSVSMTPAIINSTGGSVSGYSPWSAFFGTGRESTDIALFSGRRGLTNADTGRISLNSHDFYPAYIQSSATYTNAVSKSVKPVYMDSDGTFGYQVSATKYKTNIQPAHNAIANAEAILQIEPKQWASLLELEREGISTLSYGFIAEDFQDVGLDEVINYDENGDVDSLSYEKISMYLLEVIKKMNTRLEKLENSNKG